MIDTTTFAITDCFGKLVQLRDRVRMAGDHPHADCEGTYLGLERLGMGGYGLRVELDHCRHGVDACFVFRAADWERVET